MPAKRSTAVCVAALLLSACASMTPDQAATTALRNVCGDRTACTVRGTERVPGGYRVLIDRRPPAGNDRVRVYVRGRSVEVTPLAQDSAASPR